MAFKVQKNTIELLYRIIDGKSEVTSVVDYRPQKILYEEEENKENKLPRTTPEEQGVSSKHLCHFLQDIDQDRDINLHGIMIVKNGNVISEAASYPYKKEMWHAAYSLCKSITGLAIGILIDEGKLKLSDHVTDILSEYTKFPMLRHKSLTVRHLLTMSSGVMFNESGAVSSNEWIKAYFESNNKFLHGSQFCYNSMNSYMLSAIVSKITGENMMEYLKPRLWEPLGISQVYWELSPENIVKGGWGLYLCLEDIAKVGQMMIQKGVWNGKRIVSEEWIEEAAKKQIDTEEKDGYAYGYHVWVSETENAFLFNGMLGQNMIAYPDKNMIVVTTAGNNELFAICPLVNKIKKYFGKTVFENDALKPNPVTCRELLICEKQLGLQKQNKELQRKGYKQRSFVKKRFGKLVPQRKIPMDRGIRKRKQKFIGKSYEIDSKRGILVPIFLQLAHNNYSKGVEKLSFGEDRKGFFMNVEEGGEAYVIYIGFGKAYYQVLYYNGEPYWIAVNGEMAENEDGVPVLKISIPFIETPHTRSLKIYLYENRAEIVINEVPGLCMIEDGLASILPFDKTGFFQDFLSKLDPQYFRIKLANAIEAKITGKKIKEGTGFEQKQLEELAEKADEKLKGLLTDKRFRESYEKTAEYEKNRIYCRHDLEHLKKTAQIGESIIKEKNIPISKEMIDAAAYLHDIGRAEQYEGGEKHSKSGAVLAEKMLKDYQYEPEEIKQIVEAIEKHEEFQPEADSLSWVLYKADKLSRPCYICDVADSCNWPDERKNKQPFLKDK